MQTLSCAMIFRDSEATLERALQSVRPHVDQLVLIDTGSTDTSYQIAERYGDVLMCVPWHDHFGDMRQMAHDLCTGDWITYLDSDDELMHGEQLRGLVNTPASPNTAYLLRYVTEVDATGKAVFDFWRERVLKRGSYKWVGRVHEVLVPIAQAPYERFEGSYVLHYGSGDWRSKLERNVRLLRLALLDDPQDARSLFYLGRDLAVLGQHEEARTTLESYLLVSGWADEAYIARQVIGQCLRLAGDWGAAYRSDLQLLDIKPLWPQGYFALAQDCYYLRQFAESVHFCEIAQRLPLPETNLFVAHEDLEFNWMIYQTVALHECGRLQEAAELTVRALKIRQGDPQHSFNAAFFTARLNALNPDAVPALAGK